MPQRSLRKKVHQHLEAFSTSTAEMVAGSTIESRYRKAMAWRAEQERLAIEAEAVTITEDKAEAVALWMQEGGRPALEAIKLYGRNEKGELLRWSRVIEEGILLSADFRLKFVIDTGPAQVTKTLSEALVMTYYLAEGQINCLWSYDTDGNMKKQVPEQFHPIFKYWQQLSAISREGEMRLGGNIERYHLGRATAAFNHANSNRSEGGAAVGSQGVAVAANVWWADECSQWKPGVDFSSRLENSCIPTRPIRYTGTPGEGGGIERYTRGSDHYFYPHVDCPSCGQRTCLDPKGALLKLHERKGVTGSEWTYFSPSGRPQMAVIDEKGNSRAAQWHHLDPDRPTESACVACMNCLQPIPQPTLERDAYMACKITGVTVPEFIKSLPPGPPSREMRVVIHRSPLCKTGRVNIAAELISDGLNQELDPRDWQQQKLGHASSFGQPKLSREVLTRSIRSTRRSKGFDCILAGGDQGRRGSFLWVAGMSLPEAWEEMLAEDLVDGIIEQTQQTVLYGAGLQGDLIAARCTEHGVDFGLFDVNPGREHAARIVKGSGLELCAQSGTLNSAARFTEVYEGSVNPIPCWQIRNSRFMNAVLSGFYTMAGDGQPLIRLPNNWEEYLFDDDTHRSNKHESTPITHLLGPYFDEKAGVWMRGPNSVDDHFYCCMILQAALYIWLVHKQNAISGGSAAPETASQAIPQEYSPFGATGYGGGGGLF